MTGDGVNDAPALKKADCGIAVSGATDAVRAAASIVLMTAGLSVIIDAIKESRKSFQRMNSYAICRIAETLRVLPFMTLAILIFNFYPLTAVMIVMLALLNDGAILSIAYDSVGACIAANKVPGVRAVLITDAFSAHQGVEDDDINVMDLGVRVPGDALSWNLVWTFLSAHFKGAERFRRRLAKVAALERT